MNCHWPRLLMSLIKHMALWVLILQLSVVKVKFILVC